MDNLKIVAAPSLRKQVVDTLRTAIATGELASGERLVERVLCERIGVSRTSLREALRELENEGLVTNQSNKGMIISELDKMEAKAIFDVRASLESLVCRLFCENATEAQIDTLRRVFDDLVDAYESGRSENVIAAKSDYYDVLMAGACNEIAEKMLRSIHIRVSQLRTMSLSEPARRKASLSELKRLFASLVARDAAEAEAQSKAHISSAATAALARFV